MMFIVATTSLPVDRPNADRLERRTLVPKFSSQLVGSNLTDSPHSKHGKCALKQKFGKIT